MEAMIRNLKEVYMEYSMKMPKISKETLSHITEITDLVKLINEIAANIPMHYKELQEILDATDINERYETLVYKLANEIQVLNLKEEIQKKVRARVEQSQREYILREQLKLIREELGDETTISDAEEFEKQAKELQASDEVKEKLKKEIGRFKNTMNSPSESGVLRTYIETMLEMPWDKMQKEHQDIVLAKKILEEDHYGLFEVKERILEFLAVRAMAPKGNTPILCLVGPPGTGKTSIARSLARALEKPYVRISLGGVDRKSVV